MKINEFFENNPKVAVAFSGGVDSAYLLYAAKQYAKEVQAYYVSSAFQPQFELEDAARLAKELDVPVITLSQLSRSPDIRTDHEPKLSDLRESGSIEQDADVVMFLYRDSYYNKASEFPNIAECIIAKNRHGETNKVSLSWNGQYTKFESVEWNRDEN